MNILKIFLILLAGFLSYMLWSSITLPIKFNKEKSIRYRAAVEKLIKIRDAQLAHKDVMGGFAPTFDSLYQFLDSGYFALTQRRDTSFMEYDKIYRIEKLVEKTIIDTLGFVSVKDSLFGNENYRELHFVPFTKNESFEFKTGFVDKSGIRNPVFLIEVDKKVLLNGMDKQLVFEEVENYEVKGPTLKVGDLEKVTNSGNWPKQYESPEEK